jgi:hypothetical protein
MQPRSEDKGKVFFLLVECRWDSQKWDFGLDGTHGLAHIIESNKVNINLRAAYRRVTPGIRRAVPYTGESGCIGVDEGGKLRNSFEGLLA